MGRTPHAPAKGGQIYSPELVGTPSVFRHALPHFGFLAFTSCRDRSRTAASWSFRVYSAANGWLPLLNRAVHGRPHA